MQSTVPTARSTRCIRNIMNNSELAQNIIGQFGDIVFHSMMSLIHFSYRGNAFYETHNKHMDSQEAKKNSRWDGRPRTELSCVTIFVSSET